LHFLVELRDHVPSDEAVPGRMAMGVRCELIEPGPGPSELIAVIKTNDGAVEEVVIDSGFVEEGLLEVSEIETRNGNGSVLIELPAETARGSWRIWIPKSSVV
jgi:hypothetical protein